MIDSGYSARSVEVTRAMTIGRDTANDIVLAVATISCCHALLTRAGHVAVMDLESANGTFVNGVQVQPDAPVRLADGDLIRMGRVIALQRATRSGMIRTARPNRPAAPGRSGQRTAPPACGWSARSCSANC
jgi:pSer/pThr/pTyr-binding forkhead associated (FHA) protein